MAPLLPASVVTGSFNQLNRFTGWQPLMRVTLRGRGRDEDVTVSHRVMMTGACHALARTLGFLGWDVIPSSWPHITVRLGLACRHNDVIFIMKDGPVVNC
jgi:hypothetical protein